MDYRKMVAVVISDWLEEEGSGGPFIPDVRLTAEENAELQRIYDEVYVPFAIEREKRERAYRLHIEQAIQENAEKVNDGELGWLDGDKK
jgi:hypothetical protein